MTAQKKAQVKASSTSKKSAKTGKLEVGLRFTGKLTPQHAKDLKAEIERIAPQIVDRVNQRNRVALVNPSTFQRPSGSKG